MRVKIPSRLEVEAWVIGGLITINVASVVWFLFADSPEQGVRRFLGRILNALSA